MYNIVWNVQIGNYRLSMIESIDVMRSTEALADTAELTLPGTMYGKTLNVEGKIKRGDAVAVSYGYGTERVEFDGYVDSIATDGGSIKIKCEDSLFQFRTDVPDTEHKNISIQQLAEWVCMKIGGYTVSCSYDMMYDKYTVHNATGYDVLKKLQEETKANIYLKGNVLHVHPRYAETFGDAEYDFAVNIERDGTDLKYRKSDERKLLVTIEAKDNKGKAIKVEYGDTGGEKYTMSISGVSSIASLNTLAKEAYSQRVYDGYEGGIQGWLLPYCDAGYRVKIKDGEYEYKTGWYYCSEVRTVVSASGGVRTIKLGKRLSDG